MKREPVLLTILLALAACAYATGIIARPMTSPDEFRYAEVPREMLASGDWVVPRLDGMLYFEKPVLGYWAIAISMLGLGQNAAAARLPSALATWASAAVVFGLLRRFGPDRRVAVFAAVGLLASVEVAVLGTAAVLDALFAFGVTVSLAALFVAGETPPGARRQAWLAACGLGCGVAFLTKGFLAFAFPAVVAGPYLLWAGRPRDLLRLPWTPIAVALVTIAPWAIAIASADGDFWTRFVWNEHIRRFAAGARAQHAAPFWLYLPVLAVGALPWTSLLVPVVRRRREIAQLPLLRFAVCWLVGPLLLLSASSGKLATYVLPCFAPLALLAAGAAAGLPRDRLAAHLRGIALAVAALCAVAAAVTLLSATAALGLDRVFAEAESWKREMGTLGLGVAAGVAAAGAAARTPAGRATGIAAAMFVLFAVAGVVFPAWLGHKTPGRWLEARVEPVPDDAIVVADDDLVHAACWTLRRTDLRIVGGPGELRYGLEQPGQRQRWLDWDGLAALVRDPRRTRPLLVLYRADRGRIPPSPAPARSDTWRTAAYALYAAPQAGGGPGEAGETAGEPEPRRR